MDVPHLVNLHMQNKDSVDVRNNVGGNNVFKTSCKILMTLVNFIIQGEAAIMDRIVNLYILVTNQDLRGSIEDITMETEKSAVDTQGTNEGVPLRT